MAFKFTSADCDKAATSLKASATSIEVMLEEMGNIIESVQSNYDSEASEQIVTKFNKIKQSGPVFQEAIESCSKYLTDTVAPAYEKLEETAKSKIDG